MTMGTGVQAGTVPDPAPVEARVPWAPTVFTGSDGARHFAYELHLTNFYGDTGPLTLDDLDVFADDSTRPLLHLDSAGWPPSPSPCRRKVPPPSSSIPARAASSIYGSRFPRERRCRSSCGIMWT